MTSTSLLLLGLLLCMVTVNARHNGARSDREDENDSPSNDPDVISNLRERASSQMRHRRKRWQLNGYGYNYQPPQIPFYYPETTRADYDVQVQIFKLLDEISTYIRRPPPPPPPPQPIYIPYPVPFAIPRACHCKPSQNGTDPSSFDHRGSFPDGMDPNRIWIPSSSNKEDYDDDETEYRPISFDPLPSSSATSRPVPPVEHGSSQAETKTPRSSETWVPGPCDTAVLACCRPSDGQQRACFSKMGCEKFYSNGDACTAQSVKKILNLFARAFSPNDKDD